MNAHIVELTTTLCFVWSIYWLDNLAMHQLAFMLWPNRGNNSTLLASAKRDGNVQRIKQSKTKRNEVEKKMFQRCTIVCVSNLKQFQNKVLLSFQPILLLLKKWFKLHLPPFSRIQNNGSLNYVLALCIQKIVFHGIKFQLWG